MSQLSLAWMLCKKPWIIPIPGSRKEERIRENLGAADVMLTKEEVANIDTALSNIKLEYYGMFYSTNGAGCRNDSDAQEIEKRKQ